MMHYLPPLAPALIKDNDPTTPADIARAATRAAQGILADPADAAVFLDLEEYRLTDGIIDHQGIVHDLTNLVKRKPYLAASIRNLLK